MRDTDTMTRPKTLPKWQSELKAALKVACGLGWSVSDDRGRAQLSVSRDGKRSKLSLAPLEFEAGNQAAIVDFVSQLFRLVETGDHSLETAKAVLTGQQAQATVTATGTNWIQLKDQFKEFKLTNGTQISAKTWKLYERYLSEAVALLCKPSAPVKAFELIDRTVRVLIKRMIPRRWPVKDMEGSVMRSVRRDEVLGVIDGEARLWPDAASLKSVSDEREGKVGKTSPPVFWTVGMEEIPAGSTQTGELSGWKTT